MKATREQVEEWMKKYYSAMNEIEDLKEELKKKRRTIEEYETLISVTVRALKQMGW